MPKWMPGWVLRRHSGCSKPDFKSTLATLESRKGIEAKYWAAIMRGRVALANNDLIGAKRALEGAVKSNSAPGYAQMFLGAALDKTGDWRAAVKSYDAAVRSDSTWRTARFASISLLTNHGRFEEATATSQRGLSSTSRVLRRDSRSWSG
jgi:tetratricopeptide (TPR) repeat protein